MAFTQQIKANNTTNLTFIVILTFFASCSPSEPAWTVKHFSRPFVQLESPIRREVQRGNWKKVIYFLKKKKKKNYLEHYLLAKAYRKENKHRQAIRHYLYSAKPKTKVASFRLYGPFLKNKLQQRPITPMHPFATLAISRILVQYKMYDHALTVLEALPDDLPDDKLDTYIENKQTITRSLIFRKKNNWERAIDELKKIPKDNFMQQIRLAYSYKKDGRQDPASRIYIHVLSRSPHKWQRHLASRELYKIKQAQLAQKAEQKSQNQKISKDPLQRGLSLSQGLALSSQGRQQLLRGWLHNKHSRQMRHTARALIHYKIKNIIQEKEIAEIAPWFSLWTNSLQKELPQKAKETTADLVALCHPEDKCLKILLKQKQNKQISEAFLHGVLQKLPATWLDKLPPKSRFHYIALKHHSHKDKNKPKHLQEIWEYMMRLHKESNSQAEPELAADIAWPLFTEKLQNVNSKNFFDIHRLMQEWFRISKSANKPSRLRYWLMRTSAWKASVDTDKKTNSTQKPNPWRQALPLLAHGTKPYYKMMVLNYLTEFAFVNKQWLNSQKFCQKNKQVCQQHPILRPILQDIALWHKDAAWWRQYICRGGCFPWTKNQLPKPKANTKARQKKENSKALTQLLLAIKDNEQFFKQSYTSRRKLQKELKHFMGWAQQLSGQRQDSTMPAEDNSDIVPNKSFSPIIIRMAHLFWHGGLIDTAEDLLHADPNLSYKHRLTLTLLWAQDYNDAAKGMALVQKAHKLWDLDRLHPDLWPEALQRVHYPKPYTKKVQRYSDRFGVDDKLVWSIMRSESRFIPRVESPAGALGLMQILPNTGHPIAKRLEFYPPNLYRPEVSIAVGSYYINYLNNIYQGRTIWTLAAYNAGLGNVRQWYFGSKGLDADVSIDSILFEETRRYIQKTLNSLVGYRRVYD